MLLYIQNGKGIKHGVPQGSVLGPLLFLVYINDLPKAVNAISTPVLFADDTSVIITSMNSKDFYDNIMSALEKLNNWFTTNLSALNLDKTNFMHFQTKNSHNIDFLINYGNANITSRPDIKFLGLTLDNQLNWKTHIDNIFCKLSRSSYMITILKQTLSQDLLLMTYFVYFHSIMSYGIIFWGNSSYAIKIFKLQKRIITGVKNRFMSRIIQKS
jgi:hypothetical protein